jgi:hypothetical protein
MPSTFSPALRLELIGNGEQAANWGNTTNTNLGTLLEQAITGVGNITMADATYTLISGNGVSDEARNAVLVVAGTLSGTHDLVVPTSKKFYAIRNATTGGQSILVKTSAGTGVTLADGFTQLMYCDGTNVVAATNAFDNTTNTILANLIGNVTGNVSGNSENVNGVVLIENGGTGETTASAALASLGALPASGGTMTGDLTISDAFPRIDLNKDASGEISSVFGLTAGSARWSIDLGNTEPESGGLAGSNFLISRYNGTYIDSPIQVSRATGVTNFTQRPTHAGVELASSGSQTFTGTVTVPSSLIVLREGGVEGGQIRLQVPSSGTSLTDDIVVDITGSSFRVFEAGGALRGASINIASCASGAASLFVIGVTAGTGLNGGGSGPNPTINLNTGIEDIGTTLSTSIDGGGSVGSGATISGSRFTPTARSGTWRCMNNDTVPSEGFGLFLRIS